MKMEEIRQKYEGEWVLIEYNKLDENLNVIEGEVIAHSPNKEDIYQAQTNFKDKSLSIEYLGEIPEPEDLVVVL